jgi:hypothetical protein
MHNALAILALAGSAFGHLNLLKPLALGAAEDNELNFPLGCCGNGGAGPNKEAVISAMPKGPRGCRGHQDKFDTATVDTTWKAGEKASFTLDSANKNGLSSTHYGGSCQVGFSFDKLKTTTVATSWPGACPKRAENSDQTFEFMVPSDAPSGKALFIWTFNNREGEFFESCAPVEIVGGSGSAPGSNYTTPAAPENSETPATPQRPSNTPAAPKPSKTAAAPQYTKTATGSKPSDTAAAPQYTKTATGPKPSKTPTAPQEQPEEEPEYESDDAPEDAEPTENEPEACTGRHCHTNWGYRQTRQKRALTWAERGPMLFLDFPGADCFSSAFTKEDHATELEYPNPGDVIKGDGEYPLALPSGSACGV